MKTKLILISSAALSIMMFASVSRAATITAAGSGNWSSTTPNAPWPGGTVPASTDNVTVNSPNNVTVDSTQTIDYIAGSGTVTMAANATLNVTGTTGGTGVSGVTLNATATGNTVNYSGNAYFTLYTTYYNLIWSGYGAPFIGSQLTVLNDFTMSGSNSGQAGAAGFTVGRNLTVGPSATWDVSCPAISVGGDTTINGMLKIGCGSGNIATFSNITVNAGGTLDVGDTIRCTVSGNFTNNSGTVNGTGSGSMRFATNRTHQISGSPYSIPHSFFDGATTIGTTVTFTYSPDFNSTVIFDLANSAAQVVCANTLYFNKTLTVLNTGGTLTTGSSYMLFSAPSYNAPYTFSTINLPSLSPGLSWVTSNLTTNGSISITGTATGGSPYLSMNRSGTSLSLSWDSGTFPGYTLQSQTNNPGVGLRTNWTDTSSSTPYATSIDLTKGSVFYRLIHH